jgi:uncharacterized glyoxalase superfamily protein PhnB
MPVHPSLTYRDLESAVGFLHEAFGLDLVDSGEDASGRLRYASMRRTDGLVLLQPDLPEELHGTHIGQGWVYVEVLDVDAHYAQAVTAGVEVLGAPHPAFEDAVRGYSARDPEGNLWSFVESS